MWAGAGTGARLAASMTPETSLLTMGRSLRFQVGTVLQQMQTLNIFPLPFPPLSSVEGRFTGSWLIGTVPAAPARNGMCTPCPQEKVSHLFALRFSSLASLGGRGCVLMMKVPK